MYVVVTAEAEGFVAKPNLKERELVVFNIGKWWIAPVLVHSDVLLCVYLVSFTLIIENDLTRQ